MGHPARGLSGHKIAVIGLGYVGLPLALEFGKKYRTVGFDINAARIKDLRGGRDVTLETTSANTKLTPNTVRNLRSILVLLYFESRSPRLESPNPSKPSVNP